MLMVSPVSDAIFAGQADSIVYFVQVFDGKTFGHTQRNGDLLGLPVHGINVGKVYDCRFVAQMFERRILQVEMDAFQKQVGCYQDFFGAIVEHCRVIANGFQGRCILCLEFFRQVADQPEFAEGRYFGTFFFHRFLFFLNAKVIKWVETGK